MTAFIGSEWVIIITWYENCWTELHIMLKYVNKGLSKNVNIFMSVQTVHFFRPTPPKVYRPTFWGSKSRVSRSTTFNEQQQKLTRLRSLLCDKWYLWLCIMMYRLQLIWHTSTFNLKLYFLCIQRKYVQFHNITFKMPKSQILIQLD